MSRVTWPSDALPCEVESLLKPGDYARHPKGSFWMLRAPNGQIGTLTAATHTVEEHYDGTITVSPSLDYQRCPQGQLCELCKGRDDAFAMLWFSGNWHGWLRRGQWVSTLGDAS